MVISFWPTNEKFIEARLKDLAEFMTFHESEGLIPETIRRHKILAFFSSDVSVDLTGVYFDILPRSRWGNINGRDELEFNLRGVPERWQQLEIEFVDILVKVSPEADSAIVFASALVGGRWKAGMQSEISISQELKIELKRSGRDWEITRVVTYKTLQ
ncbi:MAG: hypothetical protein O2960_12920 [Verrucomicrobia bacterium]|nr:hypothetical protein [Verrucomicrobiota bacterium]